MATAGAGCLSYVPSYAEGDRLVVRATMGDDEERAKIGQEEGKPPFEPPWIARRKQGEKRYKMAKEAGIL